MSDDFPKITNQGAFWKTIFFCSSISFVGLFVSLPLSIAIVAMVHVHCCAHAVAREKLDMDLNGIMHLPFFGAMIVTHKEHEPNLRKSFLSAIAGPIMGLLCTAILVVYFIMLKDPFIGEMVQFMAILNIINLLPVTFFDGQEIALSLSLGKDRVIELLLCIFGIMLAFVMFLLSVSTSIVGALFWGAIFSFSIHDYLTFLRPTVDGREMSHPIRLLAITIYASLFTIFIYIYNAFEGFSDTGAVTSWILP